jgi:hypothetical protein
MTRFAQPQPKVSAVAEIEQCVPYLKFLQGQFRVGCYHFKVPTDFACTLGTFSCNQHLSRHQGADSVPASKKNSSVAQHQLKPAAKLNNHLPVPRSLGYNAKLSHSLHASYFLETSNPS